MVMTKSGWTFRDVQVIFSLPEPSFRAGDMIIFEMGWWVVADREANTVWYASSLDEAVMFCMSKAAEAMVSEHVDT